jgi:hypothetical protein
VDAELAGAALCDRVGDIVEIAIEQVDLVSIDAQPSTADDPRAPAADRRHLRGIGSVDERAHSLQKLRGVERLLRRIVEAYVIVGRVRCRAACARTAERDGGDAGHLGEGRDDALQDGIGRHGRLLAAISAKIAPPARHAGCT